MLRKIMSFSREAYIPDKGRFISDEEFEEGLRNLEEKVQVGGGSNTPLQTTTAGNLSR